MSYIIKPAAIFLFCFFNVGLIKSTNIKKQNINVWELDSLILKNRESQKMVEKPKDIPKITKTSHFAIQKLKFFEGCELLSYKCPSNKTTIGYGHKIKKNESFDKMDSVMAEKLLMEDLIKIEKDVLDKISVGLTQNQFDALVLFAYNFGSLKSRTIIDDVNNCRFSKTTVDNWVSYCHSNGQVLDGLKYRRFLEVQIYLGINIIQNYKHEDKIR